MCHQSIQKNDWRDERAKLEKRCGKSSTRLQRRKPSKLCAYLDETFWRKFAHNRYKFTLNISAHCNQLSLIMTVGDCHLKSLSYAPCKSFRFSGNVFEWHTRYPCAFMRLWKHQGSQGVLRCIFLMFFKRKLITIQYYRFARYSQRKIKHRNVKCK